MDVSPWVAMSALQKAIRRGREDLALGAAATLLLDSPDRLWRRIGCVAFEDVGIGCLDAVGLATVALAGKQVRAGLGGRMGGRELHCLGTMPGSEMPGFRRSVDGLRASPRLRQGARRAAASDDSRPDRHRDRAGVRARAGVGALVCHWNGSRRSSLVDRRGEPRLVFDQLCEAGWPHSIVEVAREGFRRTNEMLCPLVALLSGEPRVESGLVANRLRWSLGDELRREGDVECRIPTRATTLKSWTSPEPICRSWTKLE